MFPRGGNVALGIPEEEVKHRTLKGRRISAGTKKKDDPLAAIDVPQKAE